MCESTNTTVVVCIVNVRRRLQQKTPSDFEPVRLFLSVSCQEALWREEAVKKKLVALQESTSNLVNSSKLTWTVRLRIRVHRLLTQVKHTAAVIQYKRIILHPKGLFFFLLFIALYASWAPWAIFNRKYICQSQVCSGYTSAATSGRFMQNVVRSFLLPPALHWSSAKLTFLSRKGVADNIDAVKSH